MFSDLEKAIKEFKKKTSDRKKNIGVIIIKDGVLDGLHYKKVNKFTCRCRLKAELCVLF